MRFTVATNYKDKTDWHNVVCFGKTAEIQCNLKKGDYVCLDGSISYRPYTDKDGNKKISTSILANTIICMRTKGENQAIEPEDDLPF
jgi:single-strand DNA-binding protein